MFKILNTTEDCDYLLRNGEWVEVLRELEESEYDSELDGPVFRVRFQDGNEGDLMENEMQEIDFPKEIEKLKTAWLRDPCYDLHDAYGFDDFKDELKAFQDKYGEDREAAYLAFKREENARINKEVSELGLSGIYRLVLKQQELLDRHAKAIDALADGQNRLAYRILNGYEE